MITRTRKASASERNGLRTLRLGHRADLRRRAAARPSSMMTPAPQRVRGSAGRRTSAGLAAQVARWLPEQRAKEICAASGRHARRPRDASVDAAPHGCRLAGRESSPCRLPIDQLGTEARADERPDTRGRPTDRSRRARRRPLARALSRIRLRGRRWPSGGGTEDGSRSAWRAPQPRGDVEPQSDRDHEPARQRDPRCDDDPDGERESQASSRRSSDRERVVERTRTRQRSDPVGAYAYRM